MKNCTTRILAVQASPAIAAPFLSLAALLASLSQFAPQASTGMPLISDMIVVSTFAQQSPYLEVVIGNNPLGGVRRGEEGWRPPRTTCSRQLVGLT